MSEPVRPLPAPAHARLPVDEEELRRWREWLVEGGYTERTAVTWISRVRAAFAHGVGTPDGVTDGFQNSANQTRSVTRAALRELERFRRST